MAHPLPSRAVQQIEFAFAHSQLTDVSHETVDEICRSLWRYRALPSTFTPHVFSYVSCQPIDRSRAVDLTPVSRQYIERMVGVRQEAACRCSCFAPSKPWPQASMLANLEADAHPRLLSAFAQLQRRALLPDLECCRRWKDGHYDHKPKCGRTRKERGRAFSEGAVASIDQ